MDELPKTATDKIFKRELAAGVGSTAEPGRVRS